MIRVGIAGMGFMGRMHFRCYSAYEDVKVVAVCDIDEAKFRATQAAQGNISGAEDPLDLTDVEFFTDYSEMLLKSNLDIVSVTVNVVAQVDRTEDSQLFGIGILDCVIEAIFLIPERQTGCVTSGKYCNLLVRSGTCISWLERINIRPDEFIPVVVRTFKRVDPNSIFILWLILRIGTCAKHS